MKILIADDSKITRKNIESRLKLTDVTKILHATNGEEALELFKQELPDLVTLDLTMPKIGGIDCIEVMLQQRPDAKILVISALHDKGKAVQAQAKGAKGYLTKPFTDEQLRQVLEEMQVS